MNVIIAGSRDFHDYNMLLYAVDKSGFEITEVTSGGAGGVDALGERYAKENNLKLNRFPADWKQHGRAAGPIRNREMAKSADALIALWDGKSKGTKNMIDEANKQKLRLYVLHYNTTERLNEKPIRCLR